MNLHEVDSAATRANAFDLGFPRSLGFIQFIKVLVGILQNLRAFFLNDIGFSCFHTGPPLSRWSEQKIGIPSSKATRCSAGCFAKVPSRGSERLYIETNGWKPRAKRMSVGSCSDRLDDLPRRPCGYWILKKRSPAALDKKMAGTIFSLRFTGYCDPG
jgi:hypothetical protein